MKNIKSFINFSTVKFGLFLLTFTLGISASAIYLFRLELSNVTPIEIKQTSEIQPQTTQLENTFTEQIETSNQAETEKVVQSEIIDFPVNGRVIIESIQKIGEFPQMIFRAEKTGKILLRSSIEDEDKYLMPEKDYLGPQPEIRFRKINSKGFKTPMIMSVGIYHGGSDNAYYLTVFGEIDGNISRLNDNPAISGIQGGYYLGFLNKELGYGLAFWSARWEDGGHYDFHNYDIEVYQLKKGKFQQTIKKISKKKYNYNECSKSLLELGIKVTDQRMKIPEIAETLDLE